MRLRTSRGSALALAAFTTFVLIALAGAPAFSQTYTVLHSFGSGTDGATPVGIQAPGYPVTEIVGATEYGGTSGYGTVFSMSASAGVWTEAPIHSFTGTDGSYPVAAPTAGWGTTYSGGAHGYGTLYHSGSPFTPAVYSFCASVACEDGAYPEGVIFEGAAVLGITEGGGLHSVGTAYSFDTDTGYENAVYWLDGGETGSAPMGQPAIGATSGRQDYVYFVAENGGEPCDDQPGCGGVWSFDPSTGAETTVHIFSGTPDGALPVGGVASYLTAGDPPYSVFGTTSYGGAYGWGTIFEVSSTGEYSVLYNFTGGSDGGRPEGPVTITVVTLASGLTIFGTATYGGSSPGTAGHGTLWKLTLGGAFSVLHTFCATAGCPDGAAPSGQVWERGGTTVYGTATAGGAYGKGVVFECTLP